MVQAEAVWGQPLHKRQREAQRLCGLSICHPAEIGRPSLEIFNFPEADFWTVELSHSGEDLFLKTGFRVARHPGGIPRGSEALLCRVHVEG
jgi:hypothetical protein